MVHTILGIDPGLSGGLVFLQEDGIIAAAYRMPVKTTEKRSGGSKGYVDEDTLAQIIKRHQAGLLEAWIEDVHAIGGKVQRKDGSWGNRDGVVGAFSFGEGKGVLKGVLGALSVPRRYTPPATWKGAMGVTSDKKTGILKAQRMFPAHATILKADGVAEAALIALYGFMRRIGK
jgi:hypothetical protein